MNQVNTEPQLPDEGKNENISGGQKQRLGLPNIGFDHLVFVLGMVILFVAALRFDAGLIALVCVSAAVLGAVICVHFFYRNISNKLIGHPAIKNDLHAYVVNLHVNFQTATTFVVFGAALLSFFGIQTYQNFKDVQFEELKAEIKKQEDYVKTLTEKTNSAIKRADSLRQAVTAITDSLLSVKLSNVVVAYAEQGDPPEGWVVCDNDSSGRVNLANKIILGSTRDQDQKSEKLTWQSHHHRRPRDGTMSSGEILLDPNITRVAGGRELRNFYDFKLTNFDSTLGIKPATISELEAYRLRFMVYQGKSKK